mgnify:FL=1
MLTHEQAKNLKEQLIRHVESSFPEDKKEFAISQIESMGSEELEEFLIKNKLIKTETGKTDCIFCSIVFGDIKSYKIAENTGAIAVLEINPISRGHTIVIPKEHILSEKKLSLQVSALSKKVFSLIKSRLRPKTVETKSSNILGHEVINIVPVYNGEIPPERKPAIQEELSELQEILTKKSPVRKSVKKKIEQLKENLWLPKRIP